MEISHDPKIDLLGLAFFTETLFGEIVTLDENKEAQAIGRIEDGVESSPEERHRKFIENVMNFVRYVDPDYKPATSITYIQVRFGLEYY